MNDLQIRGCDGIYRTYDEHYDVLSTIEQDTYGAWDAIQKQAVRIDELEAANDAAEKSNRLAHVNLWRFWSDKVREYTNKNVKLQARIDELEEVLKSVADYVSDAADGKLWASNHGYRGMKRVDPKMAAEDQARIRAALKGTDK